MHCNDSSDVPLTPREGTMACITGEAAGTGYPCNGNGVRALAVERINGTNRRRDGAMRGPASHLTAAIDQASDSGEATHGTEAAPGKAPYQAQVRNNKVGASLSSRPFSLHTSSSTLLLQRFRHNLQLPKYQL